MKSLPAGIYIFCAIALLSAGSAAAELKPDEVAVLAMAESADSRHIAEYYAEKRHIPKSNIILLEGKPSVSLQRYAWEKKVRPAIISLLEERKLSEKIRCLATCWDVPLWIGRASATSPEYKARKSGLEKARAEVVGEFDKILSALEAFGRDKPPRDKLPLLAGATEEELKSSFNAAITGVQQRSGSMASDADKAKAQTLMQNCYVAANGSEGILQMMTPRSESDKMTPEQQAQRALVIGRIQTLHQVVAQTETLPGSEAADRLVLDFVHIRSGLFGAIRWIDGQLYLLEKNDSYSSFDSELSLIFYPDYAVLSWLPNPLHYSRDAMPRRRVVMVSRLEAPSVKIVERMIDDAVAVEKAGLQGHVYVDARGFKPKSEKAGPNIFFEYDQSLRDLADRLRKHTSLTVVSNNWPGVFQPGDCPGAALYCGWYSLLKYVDAFEWNRGAVAYHLASYEAKWLRKPEKLANPEEKPWCPAMLEDGVCATLGPVLEPFLSAFPLPDDFFSLLLTGKMTLVEVYYRTNMFNSWNMILIGDPLYTPYKANPMLDVKDLPERILGRRAAQSEQTSN